MITNRAFWPPRPVAKRPPWRRQQDCADCGVDCSFATGIGHFYTVHRHIWLSVAPGRLCHPIQTISNFFSPEVCARPMPRPRWAPDRPARTAALWHPSSRSVDRGRASQPEYERDGLDVSTLHGRLRLEAGQRSARPPTDRHKPRALEDGAGQRASAVSPRWRASRAKGGISARASVIAPQQVMPTITKGEADAGG